MKNKFLDKLVEKGLIQSYNYNTIEEEPGSGMRESEGLSLQFNDGSVFSLVTSCSGLFFDLEESYG